MKYYKKGELYELIYTSYDRWLEDMDHHIKDLNFNLDLNNFDWEEFINHINYWLTDESDHIENKSLILMEIKKMGYSDEQYDFLYPELLIYHFNGKSVYEQISVDNLIQRKKSEFYTFIIDEETELIIYDSELKDFDIGIEFDDPKDYENEDDIYVELDWPSSNIYFFMKQSDYDVFYDSLYNNYLKLKESYDKYLN